LLYSPNGYLNNYSVPEDDIRNMEICESQNKNIVNFLKNHKFQLCIVGEHLLKVTEISTSYDVKTCITTVTVPFEVWTFHNSLVVDSARWKHVPIYAFCEKNPRKNAVTQIVRTLLLI